MSRDQWRDGEGYLDIQRVVLDVVKELYPVSTLQPDLPATLSGTSLGTTIAKKPLLVVSDILPGDYVKVAWGSGMRTGSVGFDIDVYTTTRTNATQIAARLVRELPRVLLEDPDTGVVGARIASDPTTRPWSESQFHRRGFELAVMYHDKA